MDDINSNTSHVNTIDQCKDQYLPVTVLPAERLDLLDMGYEPIPLLGKRPLIKGWTDGPITSQRLKAWATAHPDHTNTGLRCSKLAIADNDVVDPGLEIEVEALIIQHLGTSMRRVGQKGGQRLYSNETPCEKMSVSGDDLNGNTQKFEILGQGQHGVGFGIHPDTSQPFKWLNGKSPKDTPFSELPEVTPEQLKGLIRAIEKLFADKGFTEIEVRGLVDGEKTESKCAGEPVTINELEAVFAHVDPVTDRNTWIGFAGALHNTNVSNADGTEADYDKEALWMRYCRGDLWKGAKDNWHDDGTGCVVPPAYVSDEDALHAFNSTGPKEGGTGFGTLKRNAQSNGYYVSLMEKFGGDEDSILPDDFFDVDGPAKDSELPEVTQAKAAAKEPRYKIYSDGEGSKGLPVEWLIKGVLARGYQTLIYGDEQVLKTFIALEMVLCAITGKPFLPVKNVPDSGYPVSEAGLTALYICGEGWRGVQMQKVPLWKEHHGIPSVIPFHSMDVMPCVLDDKAVEDLAVSIKMQFAGRPLPDIIVIDTVVYAITPLGKEDSNDDATKMYAAGKRLMELLGKRFAPIWIHHEGHSAERARGASNITKSSDVRYRCAHKTDPRFTGDKDHPSARNYHVMMTCEKFKETDLPQPVEIKGRTVYGVNAEGHPISSVILEGVQSKTDRIAAQTAKEEADDEIRQLVANLFVMKKAREASFNQMAGWCAELVKGAPSGIWLDKKAASGKRHFDGELKRIFQQPYLTTDGGWISVGDATGSGGGKALLFKSPAEAA
jgi:hypothetical protein